MRLLTPGRLRRALRMARARAKAPVLDFVPRSPRPRKLGWLLLVVVTTIGLLLARDWLDVRNDQAMHAERLQRWQDRLARRDTAALPPRQGAAVDAQARVASRRISASLRHPWPAIFGAVDEATPEGVQWLRMEHDSGRSELRLEGLGADARMALRAVDALAVRPGWRSVVLTRLGDVEAGRGMRFEIVCDIDVVALPAGGA